MDSAIKDGHVIEKSDARAVNSAAARQLYKAREPIYPKLVNGQYRALKWLLLAATLGVYYLLPWVRWPRGWLAPWAAAPSC